MKSDVQTLAALGLLGVIAICACLGAVPPANAGLVGAIVTGLFALLQPRKGPDA
jgi:hypothetical protein